MTTIKRGWHVDDEPTSVQVIYKLLSRKSKKKLEELLHQWCEWHAQECSQSEVSDEDLESGEETYLPAINVNSDKSCIISVYMDNQVNKKQRTEDAQFNKDSVPVYDLNFALLVSNDEVANKESVVDIMNASRCFNCDAYDHSLKECPKPFNKEVVSNARKLHHSKRCLDLETRKLLCLGEIDPPPWLNRMREVGYPPGYLDLEDEDEPSGITIFTNEDTKKENENCIDTNFKEPKRKMAVNFPGINAPIPVNANKIRWVAPNSQLKASKDCSKNNNINSSLNKGVKSSPELHLQYHAYEQSWQPEFKGSTSFVSDYARGQHSYARAFPLLSNYANRYWDHINQSNPCNSFYRNT